MISNNNNDSQKMDDDSGDEVEVTGRKRRGYSNMREHDMMTALGLSFTATQQKGESRLAGPTADVMAALGLSYSGNSGVDATSSTIKSEVAVEGAE